MNNVTKERCRWAIVELQAWFNYKPPLQVYRNAGKLRNEINKASSLSDGDGCRAAK